MARTPTTLHHAADIHAAYLQALVAAHEQLRLVERYLREHAAMASDAMTCHALHWGHVSDITRVVAALKDVPL